MFEWRVHGAVPHVRTGNQTHKYSSLIPPATYIHAKTPYTVLNKHICHVRKYVARPGHAFDIETRTLHSELYYVNTSWTPPSESPGSLLQGYPNELKIPKDILVLEKGDRPMNVHGNYWPLVTFVLQQTTRRCYQKAIIL